MLPLILLACPAGAPEGSDIDAEALLIDLATAHARQMFDQLEDAVASERGDLDALEQGVTHEGSVDFTPSWRADWALVVEEATGEWTHTWTIDLDIEELDLDSGTVAGEGVWTATDEFFMYTTVDHAWSGTLAIDGEEAVPVEWEAKWQGNLHFVRGAVDGEAVDWENGNPSEP